MPSGTICARNPHPQPLSLRGRGESPRFLVVRGIIAAGVLLLALGAAACSPEQGRRPGQAGADVGNKPSDPAAVEIHGRLDPTFDVPEVGQAVQRER
jgi:hypothetical protein